MGPLEGHDSINIDIFPTDLQRFVQFCLFSLIFGYLRQIQSIKGRSSAMHPKCSSNWCYLAKLCVMRHSTLIHINSFTLHATQSHVNNHARGPRLMERGETLIIRHGE